MEHFLSKRKYSKIKMLINKGIQNRKTNKVLLRENLFGKFLFYRKLLNKNSQSYKMSIDKQSSQVPLSIEPK